MDAEIENFERFGTFEMNVPEDTLDTWDPHKRRATEVVDMMWVLKKKYNERRELLKFKARGTVRGDQGKALDIKLNITPAETFAPTAKHQTFKMVCAAACIRARDNHMNGRGRAKTRSLLAGAPKQSHAVCAPAFGLQAVRSPWRTHRVEARWQLLW